MIKITEGYMPFGQYKTYYRIVGENSLNKKPLLLLHGGPGSTHNNMELFDDLAKEGRAVISYDQLGCGQSSIPHAPELWTLSTWMEELKQLREYLGLDEVHLLGQSWGGMLAIAYLCDEEPNGIDSVILASAVPSVRLLEQEARRCIRLMPEHQQKALNEAEATGIFEGEAYTEAICAYTKRHCYDFEAENLPECVTRKKNFGREAFRYAWGYNDYLASGTLKDFEYLDKMSKIDKPCLITSGVDDECTPLVAKRMADAVLGSKWVLFPHSQHMAFMTEHDDYMKMLSKWLNDNDN